MLLGVLVVAGMLAAVKYFTQLTRQSPMVVSQSRGVSGNPLGSVETPTQSNITPMKVIDPTKEESVIVPYLTPGGECKVGFTVVTDQKGIIAGITTTILGHNNTQIAYQKRFAAAAPAVLIGKKLSDLSAVDRIGRASLTTEAFNASLSKLKAQL